MSPVASLAGAYRVPVPVLAAPPDNSSVVANPILEWDSDPAMDKSNVYIHWHVQIATDVNFTSIVKEYMTWTAPTAQQFQVETSPGVWTGIPQTLGMFPGHLGKRIRCNTDFITLGPYFWRVRSEQFL